MGGEIRVMRSPADLGSPESVREVVSDRLSRLEPGTRRPARAGGNGGLGVLEFPVVRGATGMGEPELLAALDEAVRSGMIEEIPAALRAGVALRRAGAAGAL